MRIGSTDLDREVYVIAEIGGNHNGNPETAYRLVQEAARAGANAVKFQTYRAERLVHPSVEPVPIVKKHYATQLDRFKSLELAPEVYSRIIAMCSELGVDFMTSPFDLEVLREFAPHMPAIKIASGDLTYGQLISAAAAFGKPVILSTGMADVEDIAAAAALVPSAQRVLLHCVSIYPLPDDQANLRAITAMCRTWPDVPIGYSDHTIGPEACLAAVALGARVIEKHFTLDRTQVPGDHVLSLDPGQLGAMVGQIRRIQSMLGEEVKRPAAGEARMREMMRRGVYAARDLPRGHTITTDDLLFIRPTSAIAPTEADALVGTPLPDAVTELAPIPRAALAD